MRKIEEMMYASIRHVLEISIDQYVDPNISRIKWVL
jgi:hypothetical protein